MPPRSKIALEVAYLGQNYIGWQPQPLWYLHAWVSQLRLRPAIAVKYRVFVPLSDG